MTKPKKTYRILVPTDFSEHSKAALTRAIEQAKLREAEVSLLHVVDLGAIARERGKSSPPFAKVLDQMRADAAPELEAARDGLDPAQKYIRVAEVAQGEAVETILEHAQKQSVDLIVMGTHGRTGLAYDYLGSVAERVARRAPCDVLVVHARART